MPARTVLVLATLLSVFSLPACTQHKETRPNVLLIVVDDMGFADLGSFGGEIPTPHLDDLAYSGVRLSNFITAPACSPTRAMLLTGVDNHLAGLGNLDEEMAPNQRGQPGYEGYLNARVVTLPRLLQDAGYRTYMTGKWHLGVTEETGPKARGFDEAFALLTNASHFADMKPAYSPDPHARAMYREGRALLASLPADFTYSSQFFVDRMIDYLDADANLDAPFFAYLAFSAPHWPLQAPDQAIARFNGRYHEGYDVIAERRLERQKSLGLIADEAALAPRAPGGRPWHELTPGEKRVQARYMAVYAAMIAELDRHVGRLIAYLASRDELDNTIIIFLSDNGAEGHDFDNTWPEAAFPVIRRNILERHDFSYENLGRPGSYTFYGPDWARASAPALRLFKAFPTEGGVRTAAFVHYPRLFQPGVEDGLVLVKDLAATILELVGVTHPGTSYRGRPIAAMSGVSAVTLLQGQAGAPRVHVDELMGKRGVRVGEWKLVDMPTPYGNGGWQLYNLADDPGETHDLAAAMPGKVIELSNHWHAYAEANGIILPDRVSGY